MFIPQEKKMKKKRERKESEDDSSSSSECKSKRRRHKHSADRDDKKKKKHKKHKSHKHNWNSCTSQTHIYRHTHCSYQTDCKEEEGSNRRNDRLSSWSYYLRKKPSPIFQVQESFFIKTSYQVYKIKIVTKNPKKSGDCPEVTPHHQQRGSLQIIWNQIGVINMAASCDPSRNPDISLQLSSFLCSGKSI